MKVTRIYFVARIRPWTGGAYQTREYVQAVGDIDCLSCDALSPIMRIEAPNKRKAIEKFKNEQKGLK